MEKVEGRGTRVEGPGHSGLWIVDCRLWIWGKVKGEYRETRVEGPGHSGLWIDDR